MAVRVTNSQFFVVIIAFFVVMLDYKQNTFLLEVGHDALIKP